LWICFGQVEVNQQGSSERGLATPAPNFPF
jgi:hypothetical protein